MADDTLEIIEPFDYHPCNTPRGCAYYDPQTLTDCQQLKLNEFKLAVIKSDEKYLRKHPEIRGYVALITRHVLRQARRRNLPMLIKEFFDRPRFIVESELTAYLAKRPPVEEEGEDVEPEEHMFFEDYKKYLETIAPAVEETPSVTITTSHSTADYIKELLYERISRFPSADEVARSSAQFAGQMGFGDNLSPGGSILRVSDYMGSRRSSKDSESQRNKTSYGEEEDDGDVLQTMLYTEADIAAQKEHAEDE